MNKLDAFIAWLLEWVNRAIYVWGGQGETITSGAQIYRMETSTANAIRAIRLLIKRGGSAVCFDCSGLIVKWLLSANLIQYDTTADGLSHMCFRINKSDLKRGDWVFRMRDGKAYHVGVVIEIANGIIYIVEAMGRDDGVVMREIDDHKVKGYWTDFGRPRMFQAEIEYIAPDPVLKTYTEPKTDLKYRKKFIGNAAGWFETELHRIGYSWLSMGCKDDKPDEIAASKVWDILDYEMDQSQKPRGDAGYDIRAYLKSLPSR